MKPHTIAAFQGKLLAVLLSGLCILLLPSLLHAQNYTSTNNGSWTSAANWSNTSGWGGSFPSISNQGSGTVEVKHNLTISGNYHLASATVNIQAGATVTVTGDFSTSGRLHVYGTLIVQGSANNVRGATTIHPGGQILVEGSFDRNNGGSFDVYGTLSVEENIRLDAAMNIYPGGQVVTHGNLALHNSNYLNIGTNAASPPHADLVVYGNVQQVQSGDVLVRRNGRVAIFGNVTSDTNGGTLFTINNGGQVYIHGDMSYTGGGDKIVNQNGQDPWGFYVNGDISNTGGGSSTTTNIGNQQDLIDTNTDFLDWLVDIPDHPLGILPIKLRYVNATVEGESVRLAWATIMEENFHKFVVEHSADGKVFKPIGEVMGQGRNLYDIETRYDFVDHQPRDGWNYYRLKAVDYDLTFDYSSVVSAKAEAGHKWWVAPNPTSGQVKHFANFSVSDDDKIFLIDQTGNVLLQMPAFQARDGIDLSAHVSPGLYILRYVSARSEHMVRVVVR